MEPFYRTDIASNRSALDRIRKSRIAEPNRQNSAGQAGLVCLCYSRIRAGVGVYYSKDPKFIKLGEKLQALRDKHEQGLLTSIEFLKLLLELAKEAAQAEKEVVPKEEIDKGKAALTELFNGVKNHETPVIVERVVAEIDSIVKIVRFPGWQNTTSGRQEIKKELRKIVWIKYKIKDQSVFDKAYGYIEQYY